MHCHSNINYENLLYYNRILKHVDIFLSLTRIFLRDRLTDLEEKYEEAVLCYYDISPAKIILPVL